MSKSLGPSVTVSSSEDYVERMATAASHAMLPNPVWKARTTQGETGLGPDASEHERLKVIHAVMKQYLLQGTASGAFIAESGNFAACAAWWPPGSHSPSNSIEEEDYGSMEREHGTLFAGCARKVGKIKHEQVWSKYGQDFWRLGLLTRDPREPSVPGAVRSVLKPFIEQAVAEGKPIWLSTTSEHARDIYLHYGWEVLEKVTVQGHHQWCMIMYPPSRDTTRP